MSKSYRKFISFTDNQRGGAMYGKRLANKKVRHFNGDIPKGYSFLKKLFCSYDIHDYRSTFYTKDEIERNLGEYGNKLYISYNNKLKRSKSIYEDKLFERTSIRKSYTN